MEAFLHKEKNDCFLSIIFSETLKSSVGTPDHRSPETQLTARNFALNTLHLVQHQLTERIRATGVSLAYTRVYISHNYTIFPPQNCVKIYA